MAPQATLLLFSEKVRENCPRIWLSIGYQGLHIRLAGAGSFHSVQREDFDEATKPWLEISPIHEC